MSTFDIGRPGTENKIKLDSIFTSIQGEGLNTGIPMTFIRLWGCNLECPWCFTGDTEIIMGDFSRKKIKNIKKGEYILGVENRLLVENKVLNTTSHRADVISLDFENGINVKCTPDHKFILASKGKTSKALNLKCGYFIDSFRPFYWNSQYALGYLIGAIEGDGCIWEDQRGYLHLRLESIDECFIDALEVAVKHIYFRPKMKCTRWTNTRKTRAKKTVFDFSINNQKEIEIVKSLLNDIYKTDNSDEFDRGYISGFFDAEGSFSGNALCLYNYDIIKINFVKKCLDNFGFKYKVRFNRSAKCVAVLGRYRDRFRFFNFFRPKIKRKYRRLKGRLLQSSPINVKKKCKGRIEPVFNLTTETGNYFSEGFFVKNCDTPQTGEPKLMSPCDIIDRVNELRGDSPHICITGGEPFIQTKELYYLIIKLLSLIPSAKIYIETNGTITNPLVTLIVRMVDYITVSPKMGVQWSQEFIDAADEVRCPITCTEDLDKFDRGLDILGYEGPRLISPVEIDGEWNYSIEIFFEWLKHNPDWRLSFQLHKLLDIK